MRFRLIPALFALLAALVAVPAQAQSGAERFVASSARPTVVSIATYGPFQVIDDTRAALTGATDEASPALFAAMMRDYPGLTTLDLVNCPGTYDDRANLQLARMIRSEGIATHVPAGGSVRSGAVELFIAGASRKIDDGARFAVHAWLDEDGMQATDYAANDAENRKYLAFYRDMGMSANEAAAFYAMTNSVPHESPRWLNADEMRGWVQSGVVAEATEPAPPRLAYLDLGLMLN
jgi:hypothetical protein